MPPVLVIEIPVNFIDDLSAQATSIVADLFPIWSLVGGIILGLVIILFIIDFFTDMFADTGLSSFLRGEERVTKAGVDAQAAAGLFDFDDELMP